MPRLPFDPSKTRAASGGESPGGERAARRERAGGTPDAPLTVGELAGLVRTALERGVAAPVHVIGQVSNLATPNHWYFSLKDEDAVMSCVAWASSTRRFGFVPEDGDEVVATGHVSHYAPQGRTQLYVDRLAPVGAGALEQRFRAMCETLRGLGYFDAEHKKMLPAFPRRVAVVTSAGGAAVQDVIATAAERCRAVGLLVVDVRVQGEGAAEEVARAVRAIDRGHERLGVDAILVTRGGGSMEDLWAFNERVVADAVFACSVPVVAAIGHESDTTVVELVADVRAATPTQAVMRLVPAADDLHRQVDHLAHRLAALVRRRVEHGRERLRAARDLDRVLRGRLAAERARIERLAGRLAKARPERLMARRLERVAVLAHRLHRACRTRIDQRPRVTTLRERLDRAIAHRVHASRERVTAMERELVAVDPRRVLQRGYSLTTRAGRLVRSVRDVSVGDAIVTHVADGTIDSRVGGPPDGGGDEPVQMDLFDPSE
jgi:exodeoxyribonuclease VII large subunit